MNEAVSNTVGRSAKGITFLESNFLEGKKFSLYPPIPPLGIYPPEITSQVNNDVRGVLIVRKPRNSLSVPGTS